jgi:hypothetical protein
MTRVVCRYIKNKPCTAYELVVHIEDVDTWLITVSGQPAGVPIDWGEFPSLQEAARYLGLDEAQLNKQAVKCEFVGLELFIDENVEEGLKERAANRAFQWFFRQNHRLVD